MVSNSIYSDCHEILSIWEDQDLAWSWDDNAPRYDICLRLTYNSLVATMYELL
jgi:hypothetical protein